MEGASYKEKCFAQVHLLELGGCQDLGQVVELGESKEGAENSVSLGGQQREA